jgi:hypothetical protein
LNPVLLVVQLSTAKLWTIHARPGGNMWVFPLAVSPTEIVMAEADKSPAITYLPRLVRLDVTKLDAIAAAW